MIFISHICEQITLPPWSGCVRASGGEATVGINHLRVSLRAGNFPDGCFEKGRALSAVFSPGGELLLSLI